MNQTLENIMIFINENTNILIGICLFLIFVLVAYLIDNSIKAKKAMKKIKEEQEIVRLEDKEEIPIMPINYSLNENSVKNEKFEEAVENNSVSLETENPKKVDVESSNSNIFEDSITDDHNISEETMNNLFEEAISNNNNTVNDEVINNDVDNNSFVQLDNEIKNNEETVDVIYKNDKKLSDILLGGISNESEKPSFDQIGVDNIFDDNKNKTSDVVPKNVESKVEVELNESELDKIMKKLNNGNAIEEDNYTNIF